LGFHGGVAVTLLEAMVALAIVALVAVGGYEITATSTRAASASASWTIAVSRAESAMDAALTGAPGGDGSVSVAREPYAPGIDQLVVRVPVDGQASYTLRRLVMTESALALGQ
jgi:hypothetical protein